MSVLNGGLVNAKSITTDTEFVDEFCDSITPNEWQIISTLAVMGRPVVRVTELVCLVAEIRTVPSYPLRPDHPMNPASRYAEPALAVGS